MMKTRTLPASTRMAPSTIMARATRSITLGAAAASTLMLSACGFFPDKTLNYVNAKPTPDVVLTNGQAYPSAASYEVPYDASATPLPKQEEFVAPKPPKVAVGNLVKQAAGSDIVWSDVVALQEDGSAQPVLAINAVYEAAWVHLLSVLPNTALELKDKDFSQGLVMVDLPSSFGAGKGDFQLQLERGANGALLVLLKDEKLANATLAERVLSDVERAMTR